MIRRDMPEVLDIEHASFEFPWSEEDFIRCLRQRNCIGMVAEHGERVVGFMIYELHKTKLHILELRRRTPSSAAAASAARWSPSWSASSPATAAPGSRWKSARRTWPPSSSSASRASAPSRSLREHYEDTGEDAYLMQYLFDESVLDEPIGDQPHRQAARQLASPPLPGLRITDRGNRHHARSPRSVSAIIEGPRTNSAPHSRRR